MRKCPCRGLREPAAPPRGGHHPAVPILPVTCNPAQTWEGGHAAPSTPAQPAADCRDEQATSNHRSHPLDPDSKQDEIVVI